MLKTKPFDEFESLILRKHENIRHFVQKTLSGGIQKQFDINELIRLFVLFDRVNLHNTQTTCFKRYCQWRIPSMKINVIMCTTGH
jgi:predicted transcriptional regulator